jgi:hypothetical protein
MADLVPTGERLAHHLPFSLVTLTSSPASGVAHMLPRSAAEGGNSSNRIAASIASGLNACTAASCRGRDGRRVSALLARARRASRGASRTCVARRAAPRAAACDRLRALLARRALEQVREHVGPERLTVLLTQHACPSGADAAAAHSRVGSSSGRTARDCDDFKAGVVRLVLDEGKTVGAVAHDMDLTGIAGHAALSKTGSWLGEARISEVPARVMPLSTATALTSGPGRRCRCARPRP